MAAAVDASVEGLLSDLGEVAPGSDFDPAQFTSVAAFQVLPSLSELPTEAPDSTLYCLEGDGVVITACVFYPMKVSIQAGIGVYKSTLYGCAELTGRAHDEDITIRDVKCPELLVDWLRESLSYGDVDHVSISDITSHRFDE